MTRFLILAITMGGCLQYQSESIATDEIVMKIEARSRDPGQAKISVKMRAGHATHARGLTLTGADRLEIRHDGLVHGFDEGEGWLRADLDTPDGDNLVTVALMRDEWPDYETSFLLPAFSIGSPKGGSALLAGEGVDVTWSNPQPDEVIVLVLKIDCIEFYKRRLVDDGHFAIGPGALTEEVGDCTGELSLRRKWEAAVEGGLREGSVKIDLRHEVEISYLPDSY